MDVRHKRVYTPLRSSRLSRPPHCCSASCWVGVLARRRAPRALCCIATSTTGRDDVLRRLGEESDAALGTRWGCLDLRGPVRCLRDYRAATTGGPPAAARPPGAPAHLATVVLPSAGTLAQWRTPRDLLEFLWPVSTLPTHRGVGHGTDRRLCATVVGPWRPSGRDRGRRKLRNVSVWQWHNLFDPRARRRPAAYGAGTHARRAGGGDGVRVPRAHYL